jgi:excisionase family DNA binding protein
MTRYSGTRKWPETASVGARIPAGQRGRKSASVANPRPTPRASRRLKASDGGIVEGRPPASNGARLPARHPDGAVFESSRPAVCSSPPPQSFINTIAYDSIYERGVESVEISVADAAARLSVSEPRVRQLLSSGDMAGRRLGRSWLVSDESVAQLQQQGRPSGRPLGPRRAWGLLDLLADGQAAWLTPSARSQLKAVKHRLADASPDKWRAVLRGRSRVLHCQIHPAGISRLVSHERVLAAGMAMIAGRPFDLVSIPREIDQVYADPAAWPSISRALAVREVGPGNSGLVPNMTVYLPKIPWPFEERAELPDSVLAADLLDSPEPRAIRAGAARINELLKELPV